MIRDVMFRLMALPGIKIPAGIDPRFGGNIGVVVECVYGRYDGSRTMIDDGLFDALVFLTTKKIKAERTGEP